jgi:hypothetical protein
MPPKSVVIAYLLSGGGKIQVCFPTSKLRVPDVGMVLDL